MFCYKWVVYYKCWLECEISEEVNVFDVDN